MSLRMTRLEVERQPSPNSLFLNTLGKMGRDKIQLYVYIYTYRMFHVKHLYVHPHPTLNGDLPLKSQFKSIISMITTISSRPVAPFKPSFGLSGAISSTDTRQQFLCRQ
jgi:hypothetical protein